MQVVHAHLAQQAGVPAENTFVLKNGEVVCFSPMVLSSCPTSSPGPWRPDGRMKGRYAASVKDPEGARIAGDLHVKDVFVDTSGADDVGNIVVRDRQILSEEGLVVAVATVDYKHKRVLAGPDILSRGFVYMRESQDLINAAQKHVYHVLKTEMAKSDKPKDSEIRKAIIELLPGSFIN